MQYIMAMMSTVCFGISVISHVLETSSWKVMAFMAIWTMLCAIMCELID